MQRYYSELLEEGVSPQTVHHHHSLLRNSIGRAVTWTILTDNVIKRVTPPKVAKPELHILSNSKVRKLLEHVAATDYRLPIHLALHTGMRRSEICGLFWNDVDLESSSLSVVRTMASLKGDLYHLDEPKSRRSRRVIAFGSEISSLLTEKKARLSGSGTNERSQVCAREDGSSFMPDVLSSRFNAILKECEIPNVRFHDLRHTHASLLLAPGVPVHVVSARLGHASIQTTVDAYGHLLPASDVEAVEAMECRLAA